jgi:hypothetical protein
VLRWTGAKWVGVAKLSDQILGGVVINPSNVWVFASTLGTWHFNGARWQHFSSIALEGASALASNDIWAFDGTTVSNWNGRAWASTSLAKLLPRNSVVCYSQVTGIDAVSSTNVWVTATGGCEDFLGPFVLLHFNGGAWSRLAIDNSAGRANAVISDDHGGVWIPVGTGSPAVSTMLHYANGHLGSARLPYSPHVLRIADASVGHNTTTAFAVGSHMV